MIATPSLLETPSRRPSVAENHLGRQMRAGVVREFKKTLSGIETIVVVRIERVSTRELNRLRQSLQGLEANLFLVKNSLCRRAFRELGWEDLEKVLTGTCAVSPVKGEVGAVAKLLVTFSKDHEGFTLQGGILKKQVLQAQDLVSLGKLPSREVLLSQLAGVIQSPLRSIAFVLQAPLRSLVMVFSSLTQEKQKKGEL